MIVTSLTLLGVAARPSIDPPLLTANIRKSPSIAVLAKQHVRHGDAFNHIHCAAFWARAGQLSSELDAPLAEQLDEVLVRTLPHVSASFGRRELAGTAHGLAKSGFGSLDRAQPLWSEIVSASLEQIQDFTPRELATLAWSLARARQQPHELFDAIAVESSSRMSGFSPQGLATLAWGFATSGCASPTLSDAIEATATSRVADFNEQELANVAWSVASLGRPAPQLFRAIAEVAAPQVHSFRRQHLALLGWSFAVVDSDAGDTLFGSSSYVQACEAEMAESSNAGFLTQLYQWSLWRLERGAAWPGFSPPFEARCRNAFFAEPAAAPSGLEMNVQNALARMGLRTLSKVRTAEGYIIDLHVESGGGRRQLAIEVDGPWRFLGWSRNATGATLLKRRHLRFSGHRLMSIPYWEWEQLGPGADEQQRYLTLAIAVRTVRTGVLPADANRQQNGALINALGGPLLAHRRPGEAQTPQSEAAAHATRVTVGVGEGGEARAEPLDVGLAGTTWARSLRSSDFASVLDVTSVVEHAASRRIVHFGEVYASPPLVWAEAAIVRRMVEKMQASPRGKDGVSGGTVYVVFEVFNVLQQPLLDRFVSGEVSLQQLVEEYSADGDEGHDIMVYEPLLRLAHEFAERRHNGNVCVTLVAAFLPRAIARLVVAEGLAQGLETAKKAGCVHADEDGTAPDAHYAFFEASCSGRPIHRWSNKPTGLARRLFPAQVLKGRSLAHRVNRLVEAEEQGRRDGGGQDYKVLVVCGASHVAYGFGAPARVFGQHPALRADSYSVYAYESGGGHVATKQGLAEVFGEPGAREAEVADVAFMFESKERNDDG